MNQCLLFSFDSGNMWRRGSGAYRIAHYLRENNWDAEVIDFAGYWTFEQLTQLAKQRITKDTKFIGFSYLFIESPNPVMDQFGTWLKEVYHNITIIMGGPNIYRFKNFYTDYNVHGFAEKALIVLLQYLFSNGPRPMFDLLSTSGKSISSNKTYPAYPMKSLMIKYEDRDFVHEDEWLGVEFSRGCKFQCAFCSYPVLGVKGDYTRDADDFKEQMQDAYDRFGVKSYYVSDETFNDRTDKITKFADVVEKLNFETFFTGFIRPDLLVTRPEDREELLRMNFLGHFYGIETFNHRSGKAIGKGLDPNKMKQGLVDVRQYFETNGTKRYRGTISLISGLPYESIDSLYETRDWLVNNWQGQHFSIFPFEIPVSELDNPSLIGSDWKKYGYSDAGEDPKLQEYKISRSVNNQHKVLIWKNEHMNIKMADEIAHDIDQTKYRDGNRFTTSNFSLLKLGQGSDIDTRLAARESEAIASPIGIVHAYIEKKLGL